MSNPQQPSSRFKLPNNQTTQERLSTNTVGLVALSDFRKRRAEVLEQQEREVREALRSGTSTPGQDRSATPNNNSDVSEVEKASRKKKKQKKALVSFGDDEDGEGTSVIGKGKASGKKSKAVDIEPQEDSTETGAEADTKKDKKPDGKITANASIGIVPRAMTKAALRKEAAERDALRKEFLALQSAVKATEMAVPFVFYDGTNIPGGTVRIKKGDHIWVFLDMSRKVGAELGVGGDKNANVRREWARVGVDDLMLVRGTMIIPHVCHTRCYILEPNRVIFSC